ncbi:MAG: MFS transporter [Nitriliruptorales bacterium]|nr:MFS transporter [Nitriliruptorales bacterium]
MVRAGGFGPAPCAQRSAHPCGVSSFVSWTVITRGSVRKGDPRERARCGDVLYISCNPGTRQNARSPGTLSSGARHGQDIALTWRIRHRSRGAPDPTPAPSRLAGLRLFADVTPLREFREYRLLFTGLGVTMLGRQLTVVGAPIQVYDVTGSTLAVGLLGLVQFPALLVGSFLGGTLADAVDRRRLLLAAQFWLAVTTAGLALNASAPRPSLVAVYGLTAANALMSGIDSPTRQAVVPRLVPARRLPSALALNVLLSQTANAVGPAVAGLVIAGTGLAVAFWIDTASFVVASGVLYLMQPLPPAADAARPDLRSVKEGISFIGRRSELQGTFLIDIGAMVFGMPRALFPELGLTVFGSSGTAVGLLYAAPGVGAMLAALTSGWVTKVRRAGRATIAVVVLWGVSITGFGLSSSLPLALLLLAVGGGADALSAVFRSTILQLTTPDRLRGRLSAVQIAVVTGGPRLGDLEAGVVAAATSARVAAWSGGLGAAASALLVAWRFPQFRRWTPPAVDEDVVAGRS